MARIAFCSLPLPGPMFATLPLAKGLRKRGHDVHFIGMADCAPLVAPDQFECTAVFEDWFPKGFIKEWIGGRVDRTTWIDQVLAYMAERRKMLDHARFVEFLIQGGTQEFVDALHQHAPDIVLVDVDQFAYWALMVHQSQLPALYVSPILPALESHSVPPFYSLMMPPTNLKSRLETRWAWERHFAAKWANEQFLRAAGVPSMTQKIERLADVCGYPRERLHTRSLLMPQLDWKTLVMCPEELEFPNAAHPSNFQYIEACVDEGRIENEFPWEKLDAQKKLIFCSLGSTAFSKHFFQAVIDATARESSWQLVLNIGAHFNPGDFERVPGNCILVNGAPQMSLLRRASAMIHHGGAGSTKECVYWGVPQIAFPLGFDQPGMAMRLKYHGLGLVGDWTRLSADYLHSLLTELVADESYRNRSLAMSEKFRAKEARQIGAVVIEAEIARAQSGSVGV